MRLWREGPLILLALFLTHTVIAPFFFFFFERKGNDKSVVAKKDIVLRVPVTLLKDSAS